MGKNYDLMVKYSIVKKGKVAENTKRIMIFGDENFTVDGIKKALLVCMPQHKEDLCVLDFDCLKISSKKDTDNAFKFLKGVYTFTEKCKNGYFKNHGIV